MEEIEFNVKEGDKISLKGSGKVVLLKTDGISRKGRIRIVYRKYK